MPDLRMPRLNQFTLACRLVNDPVFDATPVGSPRASFSVATSDSEASFWLCLTYSQRVIDYIKKFAVSKGAPVLISGRLAQEKAEKGPHSRLVVQYIEALAWANAQDDGPEIPPPEAGGEF